MQTISVNNSIVKTLQLCTADKNEIYLPDRETREIPAKEFKALQSFLKKYKSKWQTKTQSFRFKFDTTDFVNLILTHGHAPKPNPLAYHPTPQSVIELMLAMAGIDKAWKLDNVNILEPSGGGGAVLNALKDVVGKNSVLDTCELDFINQQTLKAQGYEVKASDFLTYSPEKKYDYILMNPPFAISGDPVAYVTHIMHAYGMLKPYGRLVAVMPISFQTSEDTRVAEFREFCFQDVEFEFERIAPGTFDSTSIETCVISLRGEKLARPACSGEIFWERASLALNNDPALCGKVDSLSQPAKQKSIELIAKELQAANSEFMFLPDMFYSEYVDVVKDRIVSQGGSLEAELDGDQYMLFGNAA